MRLDLCYCRQCHTGHRGPHLRNPVAEVGCRHRRADEGRAGLSVLPNECFYGENGRVSWVGHSVACDTARVTNRHEGLVAEPVSVFQRTSQGEPVSVNQSG